MTHANQPIDGALIAQDEIHEAIHRGRLFAASRFNASLANSGTIILLLVTPEAAAAHARFGVAASGACGVELLEGPTTSAAGTAVASVNRNRASDATAATVITHTPTVTDAGVLLSHSLVPGGQARAIPVGGQARAFEEWVLAQDTAYLLRLTNVSGAAAAVSIAVDFYEAA